MKLENPPADDVPSPPPARLQAAPSGAPGVLAPAARAAPRAGIRVDRVVRELRRGRPVMMTAGQEQILEAAVETMLPSAWRALAGAGDGLSITLTAERAHASGFHRPPAVAVVAGNGGNGNVPVAAPPA